MALINKENIRNQVSLSAVLKGTLLTVALSLLFSVGTGVFYHFSTVTDQTLPWFAAVILAASSFGGSLAAGKEAGNKGLYHGLAVGSLFFVVVWVGSGLFMPGLVVLGIFYKLLITLFTGVLGGVIGVGLS